HILVEPGRHGLRIPTQVSRGLNHGPRGVILHAVVASEGEPLAPHSLAAHRPSPHTSTRASRSATPCSTMPRASAAARLRSRERVGCGHRRGKHRGSYGPLSVICTTTSRPLAGLRSLTHVPNGQ